MFKKVIAISIKDAFIRFSSRSEILFFLILPLFFTVILSGGISGGSPESSDDRIPLLVINADQSDLAQELVAVLAASDSVRIDLQTQTAAEAAFANEEAPALLLIPAGFEAALQGGETAVLDLQTQPNNLDADIVAQVINLAMGEISRPLIAARASLQTAERIKTFDNAAARQEYFLAGIKLAQQMVTDAPERVVITQPEAALTGSAAFDQTAHQSIGQLVTWVFIPLLGVSALLAYERSEGTLRRLLVTPTRKSTLMLGTISGQLALALVQMALLIGFGVVVMGVNWGQSPLGLAIMLVTFGLAAVAMGVMLGAFVRNGRQASNASIMFGMSMALLGGCWFPMEIFPPAVQQVVKILPTTWAMQGLTDLVIRGQTAIDILPIAGVLLLFAVLFFVIGVRRFRYE